MNKKHKMILIVLYYILYDVLTYLPFFLLNINLSTIPNFLYNTYFISTQTVFAISLIFLYYKDFTIYLNDFKKNGKNYLKFGLNIWFKGIFIMILSNILIALISPLDLPENEQAIREVIKISPFLIIFSSVIIAPIVEEILFRKTLFDIIKNKKMFIVVSGLLFGAFHIIGMGESLYSWLYIIPYASLGIAFSYSYAKTNNLITSICLHSFHNLITVIQVLLLL